MLRIPAFGTARFIALCVLASTAILSAYAAPQTPPADAATEPMPSFEVASVKKSSPDARGSTTLGMRPGGRFTATGMPLTGLITMAYGIQRFQLIGGPAWINSDRFDINAVAEDVPVGPAPSGTPNRMQLLLRSLLEDRFALVVHVETRELPVWHLVLARSDGRLGERLHPSAVDCQTIIAERKARGGPPPQLPKPGEKPQCGMGGGPGSIIAGGTPLPSLAAMLANMLQRPVYDRTGLTGAFDYDLEFTPDQIPQPPQWAPPPPGFTFPSPDGPSLMTALEEQLGLKLESTRGPVEVVVIDSVEQPAPD